MVDPSLAVYKSQMWTHHYPSVAHGTIVNMAPGFLNGSCGDFNVQPGSRATSLHKAATPVGKERAPLQWHTVGTFYLACFKIPYFQEGNVQHKKCGLHKQLGHNEPLLLGNRENPPQVQVPRHQPRANLVNFLKQPGYRDTLLHALPHPGESQLKVTAMLSSLPKAQGSYRGGQTF